MVATVFSKLCQSQLGLSGEKLKYDIMPKYRGQFKFLKFA